MPKKLDKSKPYIQVRISPEEKGEWIQFAEQNGFPSLSQLVRVSVRDTIEKGSKRTVQNNNLTKKVQELEDVDQKKDYLIQKQTKLLEEYEQLLKKSKAEITDIEPKHKDQFLSLLEKHPYTTEDISDIYNLPEKYVIDVCNEMKSDNLVRIRKINGKLHYEVVNHGDSE